MSPRPTTPAVHNVWQLQQYWQFSLLNFYVHNLSLAHIKHVHTNTPNQHNIFCPTSSTIHRNIIKPAELLGHWPMFFWTIMWQLSFTFWLYSWLDVCNRHSQCWRSCLRRLNYFFQILKDLRWGMSSYISYYHMNLEDILHISKCLDFPAFEVSLTVAIGILYNMFKLVAYIDRQSIWDWTKIKYREHRILLVGVCMHTWYSSFHDPVHQPGWTCFANCSVVIVLNIII